MKKKKENQMAYFFQYIVSISHIYNKNTFKRYCIKNISADHSTLIGQSSTLTFLYTTGIENCYLFFFFSFKLISIVIFLLCDHKKNYFFPKFESLSSKFCCHPLVSQTSFLHRIYPFFNNNNINHNQHLLSHI